MQTLERTQAAEIIHAAQILAARGSDGIDDAAELIGPVAAAGMFVAVTLERMLKETCEVGDLESGPVNRLLESAAPQLWQVLHSNCVIKAAAA